MTNNNSQSPKQNKTKNNLAQAVIPNSYKKLRACRACRLIKSEEQFMNDGCENCPNTDYLDHDSLHQGMIAMMQAKESWVARWNNLN